MAITDATGLSIALRTRSAKHHEVNWQCRIVKELPQRLIADTAYDSDKLRAKLKQLGIDLTVPHRKNRTKKATQDSRKGRRYKRRWKVERFFAWLQNNRRSVVRWAYYDLNFEGFILIATIASYLKKCF